MSSITLNKFDWLSFRRPFDVFLAMILFLGFFPMLIFFALAIKVDGGPAFFTQNRVGLNGRIFRIYKFRSMIPDADKFLDEEGMPTRNRVTRIGSLIRKTSIDELPQLLNIVKGDMALIGPRPILPVMVPFMTVAEKQRFLVRPGVTGWAQVIGRNLIPWSQRFKLDCQYIRRANLLMDAKIIILTVVKVVLGSDVSLDRNANQVDDVTTRSKRI